MKKNKNNVLWHQSPDFLKKLFAFVILFTLLLLSLFIIWKRYMERELSQPIPLIQAAPLTGSKLLSDRPTALENRINQQQQILLTFPKLVAIELLRAVLKGWIPLKAFKTFLQKNPDPWAQDLLTTLALVKESKTYPQLEALLVLPPSQPLSTWKRIKRKIKSLVQIRKLDEKSDHQLGQIEGIQKALHDHDIQKSLESFEELSPQEKAQLSSWKDLAQDRFKLEKMLKKLILELATG
jgi:hypothetical protein